MVVAIIDSHPVFLNGLTEILQDYYENSTILRTESVRMFHENRGDISPDLIILGVNKVLDIAELEAFETIKKLLPTAGTIIFYNELNLALPFLTTGANGFLAKKSRPEELRECIAAVTAGGNFLDPQIFDLIFTAPRPIDN